MSETKDATCRIQEREKSLSAVRKQMHGTPWRWTAGSIGSGDGKRMSNVSDRFAMAMASQAVRGTLLPPVVMVDVWAHMCPRGVCGGEGIVAWLER